MVGTGTSLLPSECTGDDELWNTGIGRREGAEVIWCLRCSLPRHRDGRTRVTACGVPEVDVLTNSVILSSHCWFFVLFLGYRG